MTSKGDDAVSVDDLCALAFHDMVEAMAYPLGILTVKQMQLVKKIGKMLGIPEARQRVELQAVFVSYESKRMSHQKSMASSSSSSAPIVKRKRRMKLRKVAKKENVSTAEGAPNVAVRRTFPVAPIDHTLLMHILNKYRGHMRTPWRK